MPAINWFKVDNQIEVFAALGGIAGGALINTFTRRPAQSGVHKHIAFGLLAFWSSKVILYYADRQYKRRQIYLEDYISKHPDDFIEPPRKKFLDEFGEYVPIR